MDCITCKHKQCKTNHLDCNNRRDEILECYEQAECSSIFRNADALLTGGRAGTLSRLDEIIEFCGRQNYQKVGIAYCHAVEDLAGELRKRLRAVGLNSTSYRCTVNGIVENQIDCELGTSVACNPIGQAQALQKDGVDFVVEMGLCLGHDVIFHQHLKVPHTVLLVKDRLHRHRPAASFRAFTDENDEFITSLDNSFKMRSLAWLLQQFKSGTSPLVIDLRDNEAFDESHVPGSLNIDLKELPNALEMLVPHKERAVVCICNGSIQSAYAVMYLSARGFKNVFILSGGYSAWKREVADKIERDSVP